MRTTLTLEDDVAVRLERLRQERAQSLKSLVNELLRRGLADLERGSGGPSPPFRTRSVSAGRCLLPSLDDVAQALELAEGPAFK